MNKLKALLIPVIFVIGIIWAIWKFSTILVAPWNIVKKFLTTKYVPKKKEEVTK